MSSATRIEGKAAKEGQTRVQGEAALLLVWGLIDEGPK